MASNGNGEDLNFLKIYFLPWQALKVIANTTEAFTEVHYKVVLPEGISHTNISFLSSEGDKSIF